MDQIDRRRQTNLLDGFRDGSIDFLGDHKGLLASEHRLARTSPEPTYALWDEIVVRHGCIVSWQADRYRV